MKVLLKVSVNTLVLRIILTAVREEAKCSSMEGAFQRNGVTIEKALFLVVDFLVVVWQSGGAQPETIGWHGWKDASTSSEV